MRINERSFFCRTCHSFLILFAAAKSQRLDNVYLLRRFTIMLSVRLLLRVLYPRVGCPQGVTGWRPPEVLPSPPPCGWSTGFMTTPRLVGRIPSQRVRPALPMLLFSWSRLLTCPMVAMQLTSTLRVSPEGSLISA